MQNSWLELVRRQPNPIAWNEGDNIPWSDPGFSRRMLDEHLSQEHDAASRRAPLIDRQVAWIHGTLLADRPSRILDLGCGPGLYTARLAAQGHQCTGIDYSPASIAYARKQAGANNRRIDYVEQDLRQADPLPNHYDLVMLLFGEMNIFRPAHIRRILGVALASLVNGGTLLLEAHTFSAVRAIGTEGRSWYSSEGGLFSEKPHLVLTENQWHPVDRTATVRHFVIDATDGQCVRHAQSFQAYTNDEYLGLLEECGFTKSRMWPTLGDIPQYAGDLLALTASKQEGK